ncbi:nfx1-type zinc finger-containing protein 1 [Chrysochromulina tobinii]|uniref:Nfx1-type zinc finger-containing protein 1 n=1 Tax=Chrysochromulina tobinii TaxID=1460289 RepID=A0A0M0JSV1_9EUKA|nr:nfx1-type zinc finger-containing protein 1 [Chrysochromulina tobinii]|eukprot:KOO29726.1 nfx1-type zinc finger-containing protein 1 [Chrysochromulina sp. CCMP291]
MGLPADEARRLADAQRIEKETAVQERAKAKKAAAETPAEAEEEHFAGEAKRWWGAKVEAMLVKASAEWRQAGSIAVSSTDWPTNPLARKEAEKVIAALAKSSDRASVEAAEGMLKKQLLKQWAHSKAYLAVAYTCTPNLKEYAGDAKDMIEEYMEMAEKEGARIVPAVLLAVARLCSEAKDDEFKAACLRRCYVHETQALLTADEQRIASSPVGAKLKPPLMPPATSNGETPMARWKRLKAEPGAKPSPSLDKLMEMIGLKSVKEEALELYTRVLREQGLAADRRQPFAHNFAFLGNPGTGKTSVAKLFGKILKETGAREKDVFVVSKGEELARDGADKAAKLISSAMGGVLFIDEAYALEPLTNTEGKAVAMQLLDVAEDRRNDLTIIIAGYKEDIETKLFGFNSGFSSRFSCQITFEDYTEPELAEIFQSKCKEMKVPPEKHVVEVAARRLARGRGAKGFGNARAVRILFDKARSRALVRDAALTSLKVIDVIGPRPDRDNVPDLGRALDELQEMIGLDSVKQSIERIVTLAQTNYDKELKGSPPFLIPLNRVFLGNPGTGKTTVAKIYGRILKGLDYLSDGKVELKQPSDLVGEHVGSTAQRTSALIGRCMGKVLLIDEAYALNNNTYGHEAIDALVGLVHGAPGEDIAVVLIGYEKQMKKMFREVNNGLTRRFGLDDAFRFEDFSDKDLDRIILKEAGGLRIKMDPVRIKVIKALAGQRARPNFGNAGAVVAMVARAKERMNSRDTASQELTLSDFGLDRVDGDGLAALKGLCKIEEIRKMLGQLKATLEQCDRDGKDRSEYLRSYLFLGGPGTGKTTVARAMAQILNELGVLGTDKIVICSALDLQGSYEGQTKDKVNEKMLEAQGGVLFIDEAYTLGGGTGSGAFSQEAVDQLVKLMTDPEHLKKTVVILAGYKDPMEQMMRHANPGLRSRFEGRIEFPDWSADDCVASIRQKCEGENIRLRSDAEQRLLHSLREIEKRPGWANARDSVTTYRLLYEARAQRSKAEAEACFTVEDVAAAMASLKAQRPPGESVRDANGFVKETVAAKAEHQRVQEQYKKEALVREKIRQKALCPAGFDWHRERGGWRCNGGSHFISNDQLPTV